MNNLENLIQWSRFLYRTSKIQNLSSHELENKNSKSGIYPNEMLLLFFALLYVTVEAFNKYAFRDKRIKYLIGNRFNDRLQLLKNIRNSIFHPDDSIFSPRQSIFLQKSDITFVWAYALVDEFERFLYFYPESINIKDNLADQIREQIRAINNWLPESSLAIIKNSYLNEFENYKLYVKDAFPNHYNDFCSIYDVSINEIKRLPDSYFDELF